MTREAIRTRLHYTKENIEAIKGVEYSITVADCLRARDVFLAAPPPEPAPAKGGQ